MNTKASNPKPNRNITRIDTQNPNGRSKPIRGWEVRIYRRGVRFNKFFSDAAHGGKTKALEEARKMRDEKEAKLKPWTRRQLAERPTARNTSGHRGVRLRKTIIAKDNKKYVYEHIEASWSTEPGTVVKKSFSVAKLGLQQAWKDAIEARNKGLASIKN